VFKITRQIFTPGTLSGENVVWYKALAVKVNETTAILLISTASYTH